MENAILIKNSGVMFGSNWEAGCVCAWKLKPSKYAILNSGASFGVVISFKTNAQFIKDWGIEDPEIVKYGPVRTLIPGPIAVWDVEIVGK